MIFPTAWLKQVERRRVEERDMNHVVQCKMQVCTKDPAHKHTNAQTRARTRTVAHTHTFFLSLLSLSLSLSLFLKHTHRV